MNYQVYQPVLAPDQKRSLPLTREKPQVYQPVLAPDQKHSLPLTREKPAVYQSAPAPDQKRSLPLTPKKPQAYQFSPLIPKKPRVYQPTLVPDQSALAPDQKWSLNPIPKNSKIEQPAPSARHRSPFSAAPNNHIVESVPTSSANLEDGSGPSGGHRSIKRDGKKRLHSRNKSKRVYPSTMGSLLVYIART
ncbi:uncharacterized protein BDZ99DRAFT_552035 [Mytilinidion resinicola]|uniref:Uncharacterized protein n=1 Tax=Mytilinidion resinicola TaxID=574789 RepID=A0A6A6Y2E5_9PEZI|nr:uncharacterized protein BDZ99DRAFT_552035 [Mytilinidion resinicola]KAF2802174.1 hypothetical protein BDZ99DRAFT_552035 [Mytilinidion resinicola]